MYKEDIDLMYRLRWAGFKCIYQPEAVAWHDRTTENPGGILSNIKKRRQRPAYIKENSYLNQLILTYKNWSPEYSFTVKLKTTLFLLKYTFYLLLFDFKTLKVLKKFKKLLPTIKTQRQTMLRKISAKEMETWFK
jgi:GT2 family glycosyltransferase